MSVRDKSDRVLKQVYNLLMNSDPAIGLFWKSYPDQLLPLLRYIFSVIKHFLD